MSKKQTIDRNRMQLAALFRLYVATARCRAGYRSLGMHTRYYDERLQAIRAGLHAYIKALREGVPCDFQKLGAPR